MKRLLTFDEEGFYLEEEIVQDGTEPSENQYLADLNEVISFYKPKLVDGEVVEGLTEEEIEELTQPVEQPPTTEDRVVDLESENKMLKLQVNTLTDHAEFLEEALTELIISVMP